MDWAWNWTVTNCNYTQNCFGALAAMLMTATHSARNGSPLFLKRVSHNRTIVVRGRKRCDLKTFPAASKGSDLRSKIVAHDANTRFSLADPCSARFRRT